MKRFLFVVVLAIAGIAVLGFYREWFTFSVDKDKFREDRKSVAESVTNVGSKTDDKNVGKSHDGKVVSITDGKLVMTNMEGEEEHVHILPAEVKITCDGKACKAEDLKAGMRIRVTTEKAGPHETIRIEALDNQQSFEKGA